MITQNGKDYITRVNDEITIKNFVELNGLSTDTKPTDVANGSTFFEMDTGKAYMFNQANTEWKEL